MTKATNALVLVLTLASCHGPIPEGRYPCSTDGDCPPRWSCHADRLCWSTPETGNDAGVDAFVPADASRTDAPMLDTGPVCTAETCNGADDDCDGLIDEGVMRVGAAVTATTTTGYDGARLIGTANGFSAILPGAGAPSSFALLTLARDGTPLGSLTPLGADLDRSAAAPFDVGSSASAILVTSPIGPADVPGLAGVDAASGERTLGAPWPLPTLSGADSAFIMHITQADASAATIYAMYVSPSGGPASIHRLRISLAASGSALIEDLMIVSDAQAGNAWAVLRMDGADVLTYVTSGSSCVVMAVGATSTDIHLLGLLPTACGYHIAMAVRDPRAPISGVNPLGLAWESLGEPLSFIEVSSTAPWTPPAVVVMPDSAGSYRDPFTPPHLVVLRALPAAAPGPGHWLVANVDQDGRVDPHTPSAAVQVREVVGDGATVRRLDVPGEAFAPRTDIDIDVSATTTRLIERANGMGIVTRSIGCE